MTKPVINQLGSAGMMLDGDPTMIPDQAFTDVLNVRFNGREIEQTLGNVLEPYYETDGDGTVNGWFAYLLQTAIFDGFSNGARLLFQLMPVPQPGPATNIQVCWQNMDSPSITWATNFTWAATDNPWLMWKTAINNCPIFGCLAETPMGKQYDWEDFATLTGWGEQTTGNDGTTSNIVTRRWSCRRMVAFDSH